VGLQLGRERRGDVDPRLRERMSERKVRRVQELASKGRLGDAVDGVTDHGQVDGGKVDTDLVSAAGLEPNPQERVPADQLLDLEVRRRVAGAIAVERLTRGIGSVTADRGLDPALPRTRPPADEREVRPFEVPPADEVPQALVRLARPGDDEEARRVAVEPVDDSGPLEFVPTRGAPREQAVDERSVGVAGRGMNDDAGGLVDDEEVLVLEGDAEVDVLGHEHVRLRRRQVDVEELAALEPAALRGRSTVDPHRAGGDQPLGGRARADLFPLAEEPVEPGAGGCAGNPDLKRQIDRGRGRTRCGRSNAASRMRTPRTMKVSARLKAGQ